jgi:glycosyltransferase involved in cell wall biosynthesis
MTYLVDAHHLGARQTGNETWTRNITLELSRVVPADDLVVCVRSANDLPFPVVRTREISGSAVRRLAFDLPREARRANAGAILVQYTMPLTRRPCVVMIQDMASFDARGVSWLGSAHAARIRLSIATSVKRAAVVMAPSKFTQADIADRFNVEPDTIPIAHCAVDPALATLIDRADPNRAAGPARVLVVGNVLPRKNLPVLGRALALLRARGVDVELRVVGQAGRDGADIAGELQSALGSAVSFSGFVTADQLAAEYRKADVFAFPSLYEGFGIPALEAMYAGVPVVVSRSTSLPEVVGDDGLVVSPDDPEEWAASVDRILSDSGLRGDLIRRGRARAESLTWASSAEVVLEALSAASIPA